MSLNFSKYFTVPDHSQMMKSMRESVLVALTSDAGAQQRFDRLDSHLQDYVGSNLTKEMKSKIEQEVNFTLAHCRLGIDEIEVDVVEKKDGYLLKVSYHIIAINEKDQVIVMISKD